VNKSRFSIETIDLSAVSHVDKTEHWCMTL
jgi:hypothetical protein